MKRKKMPPSFRMTKHPLDAPSQEEQKMETKTFSVRLGNLEARRSWSGYEIVQWGESSCWVLAHWIAYKDGGFYLKFVGDRPFGDKVNPKDFWTLARMGQNLLDYGLERLE